MKTNKIVFAGVMGAILMSAGANAATTSVATKGYVDQEIGKVSTTVENIEKNYVTIENINDAIESGTIDLSAYQITDNMVQSLNGLTDEQKAERYPSVAAVAAAIESMDLGLTTEQITALQQLIQSDGVVSQLNTLKGRVDTLTGTGDGSIAKQIADALTDYSTTDESDAAYQAQSTADYQIGMADGKWQALTSGQIAALDSGITQTIVTTTGSAIADLQEAIEGLNGKDGVDGTITTIQKTIADLQEAIDGLNGKDGADGTITTIEKTIAELQNAIDGLNGKDGVDGTITTIEKTIAELQNAINDEDGLAAKVAENTASINTLSASPIYKPSACDTEACVLMVKGEEVFWTPVTNPVDDPASTPATGE